MKFNLDRLAVWRRIASPPLLPAPLSRDENRIQLAADFQRARYGVTCRTLSFPASIEGESVYYRALATSADLGRWDVQRISERPMQMEGAVYPVDTPNIKMNVVQRGLGFFDALEYLARYEKAQSLLPLGPTRQDLGNDHYEAFALLHNIVTDMQGMPQPTIGGHVAISGEYPQSALRELRDAQQQSGLKRELEQKALLLAHTNATQLANGFEEARHKIGASKELQRTAGIVSGWVALFRDLQEAPFGLLRYGDSAKYQKASKGEMEENTFNHFVWDWSFKLRIEKLSEDSLKTIEYMKELEPQDRALALGLIHEMRVIGLVEDGKYLMDIADSTRLFDGKPMDMIDELAKQYAALAGFTEKIMAFGNCKNEFKARILREPKMKGLPSHILEIARDLEQRCAEREAEAKDALHQIRPPQIQPPGPE